MGGTSCSVVRGSPSGLDTEPVLVLSNCRVATDLGDFDGDGYADLGVQDDTYSMTSTASRVIFGGPEAASMTVVALTFREIPERGFVYRGGDVNGDGLGDMVFESVGIRIDGPSGDRFDQRVFSVLLGNAARSLLMRWGFDGPTGFETPEGIFVPGRAEAYAAGDFTGDGYGDIVIAPEGVARGVLFFGSAAGLGYYARGRGIELTLPVGATASATRLGDTNGDGLEDLELYGMIRHGSATGLGPESAAAGTFACVGYVCPATGAGDLNDDGLDDVIQRRGAGLGVDLLAGSSSGPRPPVDLGIEAPGAGLAGISGD
jgi:hypothetical protein